MKTPVIKPIFPADLSSKLKAPVKLIREFLETFQPVECAEVLHLFVDARTSALYAECHMELIS